MKFCPQCESRYGAEVRFCPVDGATLRASEAGADLIGVVVADRYIVLETLGEGGMGRVYLAEHVRMGRRSALKVMHPGMMHDADAIARFNREAANASRISHPNVAAIYDFGETSDGLIYLAMEYIDGEPLTALVERQGALPAGRAAAISAQVADALAAAHEMGIVHRDLKPDNVMIARGRDDGDIVKVVDFGIAKSTDGASGPQKVTRTGYIVGTPEYMSPEQLAGDPLDGRSDVYALGLVTFHMLTGALPFPSATVQESMIMRLTERPRTLSEARAGVEWPAELQAVLDRALAREAKDRYGDARQFRHDLVAAITRMPGGDAASAGTLLMHAPIPATRVAAPLDAEGTGGTGRLDATRSIRTGTPAAASRGRTLAIYGAVTAAVILIAAVGYAMSLTDARSPELMPPIASADVPAAAPDSARPSAPGAASTQRSESADPATDGSRSTGDATGATSRPDPSPVGGASPPAGHAGERGPAFDARAALNALASLLEDFSPERGRAGLARIDSLLPRLAARADSVEALYRRAESYAMLEKQPELCGTLDAISGPEDLALVPQLQKQIGSLRSSLCSP